METINLDAAETQLARLVAEAAAGNEIVITRAGQPVARLVPFASPQQKPRRVLGALRATLHVPPDFDAPLPDEVRARFEGA
ncbi:MAG: type II toxin-antitoxin system Phd/YefM family antitoxin [Janthinobacterium lividum]